MIGIYKIASPTGRVYIGQSIDIDARVRRYKNYKCKLQKRLYLSLIKYGWENHNFDVLEECPVGLLNERERHWQDFYNVLDKQKGLNCKLTEHNGKSGVYSDVLKKKISDSNKGKKFTEEHRSNLSKARKGKNYFTGKHHSAETKLLFSKQRKGKYVGGNHPKSKPVFQTKVDGEFVSSFVSMTEAANICGLNLSKISDCCRGERNTHGGYKFYFAA